MTKTRATIAEDEQVPAWGPKMTALGSDKQRAFVAALYSDKAPRKGDGLLIWAAHVAGYGNKAATTSSKALSVIANRLIHSKPVQAAIAEYSHAAVRAISPEAVRTVRHLIRNTKHRDTLRAAVAVLDRVVPVETRTTLQIEDNRPPSAEAIEWVLEKIEQLARRAGIVPPVPPAVIEGEFKVVEAAAP